MNIIDIEENMEKLEETETKNVSIEEKENDLEFEEEKKDDDEEEKINFEIEIQRFLYAIIIAILSTGIGLHFHNDQYIFGLWRESTMTAFVWCNLLFAYFVMYVIMHVYRLISAIVPIVWIDIEMNWAVMGIFYLGIFDFQCLLSAYLPCYFLQWYAVGMLSVSFFWIVHHFPQMIAFLSFLP